MKEEAVLGVLANISVPAEEVLAGPMEDQRVLALDRMIVHGKGSLIALPARLAARVVYEFLTGMIYEKGTGYFARQVLRTVRGLVARAMGRLGVQVPPEPT